MRKLLHLFSLVLLSASLMGQKATWLEYSRFNPLLDSGRIQFPAVNKNREPVRFSYPFEAAPELMTQAPYQAQSRGYSLQVTGSDLVKGVEIPTTVPGALVRISGQAKNGYVDQNLAIRPENLVLVTPSNRVLTQSQGVQLLTNPEVEGDNLFPEATSVFRIKPEHGSGIFILFADQLDVSRDDFLIQVQEKESPAVLNLQSDSDFLVLGEKLQASIGAVGFQILKSSSRVVFADGSSIAATVDQKGRFSWDTSRVQVSGMVELVAHVEGQFRGQKVMRDARTVFQLSVPTARFGSEVELDLEQGAPLLRVGLEVGRAGRYEVRGVWFGRDEAGQEVPMGVAQAAQWLGSGKAFVDLDFDPSWAESKGLKAPFRFGSLELLDQTQMAVLQNQAQGIELQGF